MCLEASVGTALPPKPLNADKMREIYNFFKLLNRNKASLKKEREVLSFYSLLEHKQMVQTECNGRSVTLEH